MVAVNAVGYGGAFPSVSARSSSPEVGVNAPAAPSQLAAALQAGPTRVALTWRDNASNETGFVLERSTDGGATFTRLGPVPARTGTGNVTFTDNTVTQGASYVYRVAAENVAGVSPYTAPLTVKVDAPAAPSSVTATATRQGCRRAGHGELERGRRSHRRLPGAVEHEPDVRHGLGLRYRRLPG